MVEQRERVFGQGQVLFRQGEKGGDLFFLRSGEVELSVRDSTTGEPAVVAVVAPPSVLGTMTFLEGDARSATGKALTAVKALVVGQEQREELLNTVPDWFKVLVKDLTSNLRRLNVEYARLKTENEDLKKRLKILESRKHHF